MTDNPLVTVMIPTYNQAQYIKKTISSVLEQTYSHIEIIVSDDSTNSETEKIITENFPMVRYIHHIPSLGRVNNYSFMLHDMAKGDWVLNLDGDDFLYDIHFISNAIKAIKFQPAIAFVFAKQILYDERTQVEYKGRNQAINEGILNGSTLFLNTVFSNVEIPHLATLYNKNMAIQVGFYESDISSSDRKSILKLALGNQVVFLDAYVGIWRQHENNISKSMTENDFFRNLTIYDDLYIYARKYSEIRHYKLWIWKSLGKYKQIYAYILKLKNKKMLDEVRQFKYLLMKKYKLYRLLLSLDIRLSMRGYIWLN